jgi:adenylate kinase
VALNKGAALNVVMLGPPGAGKGTQAERFARRHGVPKISTGDILREAVAAASDLGRAARETMNAGNLVGDDVMIGIVEERLARPDAVRGFVLDGFPRTVVQASALDRMMNTRGKLVVVEIVVPEDVLVRRLAARRICSVCGTNAPVEWTTTCGKCGGALVQRTDDGDGIVRERLKV